MNIRFLVCIFLLFVAISSEQIESAAQYRTLIRESNRKLVEAHNSKEGATYKMKLHARFAENSFQQIKAIYFSSTKRYFASKLLVEKPNKKSLFSSFSFASNLYVNWTEKGFVSPVTDQGSCGSCYAHAAIGDIQSTYLMKGLKVSLSIQQIVDCSNKFYNEGCYGGWMANVFDYAKINGLVTYQAYPTLRQTFEEGKSGACLMKRGQFRIKSYKYTSYRYYDCQSLTAMVMKRPVSVGVQANFAFVFYYSGIFTGCDPIEYYDANHAMLVTGIYKDAAQDYWIARNSWGVQWGQQGYINIDRYLDYGNQCQICLAPVYSIL